MGCQPTKCNGCGGTFKACQLVNGLCSYCRNKTNRIKDAFTKTYKLFRMF